MLTSAVHTMHPQLQVLAHIAQRCGDLHAARWVHRDIKPANVMMLLRKKRWTLMDFGTAAKAGTRAQLVFTKSYAPPEVMQAACSGKQYIVASGAMDAWSLGILGIEMFTGKPVFPKHRFSDGQVLRLTKSASAQLCSVYPWCCKYNVWSNVQSYSRPSLFAVRSRKVPMCTSPTLACRSSR